MKCYYCEINEATERHHIIPRSQGGKGNIIRVCKECHDYFHNSRVGNKTQRILNEFSQHQDFKNLEKLLDFVEAFPDVEKQIYKLAILLTSHYYRQKK